jgi:hypothetical protein
MAKEMVTIKTSLRINAFLLGGEVGSDKFTSHTPGIEFHGQRFDRAVTA